MRRAILLVAMMAVSLLLASGVALAVTKIGTDGPDTLRGTNGADQLVGKGGNDILLALAGNDTLLGGGGKDIIFGGSLAEPLGGTKNMVGGDGNDAFFGGLGSDNMVGGDGNDFLLGAPGPDKILGGAGNDVIDVLAAGKDVVSCGDGFDRVIADRADVVAPDCERVFVGERKFDAYFASIPASFFEGLHPRF
jgi:hypothetical protein